LAQEAYSAVDSARGGIATALADLDRMHQESVASGDRNRQAQVESAIAQLQALDQAERAMLAQLLPAA
jgi:transcription elongation GreA/GreB family factor